MVILDQPRTREIIDPTCPLLEARRAAIEAIECRTFIFRKADSLELDVYYPPSHVQTSGFKPPIVVFFYGGGFVTGRRRLPTANLLYQNIGAFFASRGLLTVVPDYRLVPSIVFPEASHDTADALTWIIENLGKEGDTTRVFVVAHSAGGVHIAGALLLPHLFSTVLCDSVKGVIFLGVPFELTSQKPTSKEVAEKYYGNTKNISVNQPLSLLKAAKDAYVQRFPKIWCMVAGSEPKTIKNSTKQFLELLASKGSPCFPEVEVLAGHDHFSPVAALSSDSGEEWGEYVVKWAKSSSATER